MASTWPFPSPAQRRAVPTYRALTPDEEGKVWEHLYEQSDDPTPDQSVDSGNEMFWLTAVPGLGTVLTMQETYRTYITEMWLVTGCDGDIHRSIRNMPRGK